MFQTWQEAHTSGETVINAGQKGASVFLHSRILAGIARSQRSGTVSHIHGIWEKF